MGLVRAYVVSAMAWEMDLWVVGDASKGNFVPRDAKQLDAGVEVDVWWVVFFGGRQRVEEASHKRHTATCLGSHIRQQ